MACKKLFLALLLAASLISAASCGEKEKNTSSGTASENNWVESLPDVDNSSEISSQVSSEPTVSASDSPAVLAPGAYTEKKVLSFNEGENIFGLWMHPDDSLDVLVQDFSIGSDTSRWYHSDDGNNFTEKDLFWKEELASRLAPYTYAHAFSAISADGTIYLVVSVREGEREIDMQVWSISPEQKLEQIDVGYKEGINDMIFRVSSTGKATLFATESDGQTRCYDIVKRKEACKISAVIGSGVDGDLFAYWNNSTGKKGVLSLYDMNTGKLLRQQIAKKDDYWDVRVGFGPQEVYVLDPDIGILSLNKETGEWKQLIAEKKFAFNEVSAGRIFDFHGDSKGNLYYPVSEKGLYKLTYDPNGTQEP